MKVTYDPEADAMTIILADAKVADSDQVAPGVILDFDSEGNVIAVEILDAGKHGRRPHDIAYRILQGETAGR